ncbi:MAG: dihydropteroate synthase [Woeseia sp.]|nr:dihydropteroate synthase [Woeseia sp.]MBT8095418.1 dihydropteroate synthase [Woeseia sp.]NNE61560.1 dihydropteroate synthase [Woeseia sp.]NNL55673.1 dihydropteroate synthase [Woeseia sp.]
MQLTLGKHVLDLTRPKIMGILNVTPDSFSDGGDFVARETAVQHALAMVADGADIIDVGGESTRPGANEVSVRDEIARVVPVIEALAGECSVPLSVDTSKPEVMRAAVAAGATLVNDVYALQRPGAVEAVCELAVGVCLMHMRGTPRSMQENPTYDSVPDEVAQFLDRRVAHCEASGIARERIIVDPGFGFGKTDEHNLLLLSRLDRIVDLGRPVLVGLSRKRTLGNLTGRAAKDRVASGIAAAVLAVERGAHIVRTHDVAATADALAVVAASAAVLKTHKQSEAKK